MDFKHEFISDSEMTYIVSDGALNSNHTQEFIRCFDFTHIAASNTASDDVTN